MNDPIAAMQDHIEALRHLLQNFDLTTHNDHANPQHVEQAQHALDDLDGHIGDLIP